MLFQWLSGLLPLFSAVIAFVFAFLVLQRWYKGRRLPSLFWGIGLLFYGAGGAMEAYYGLLGWHPLVFRLWYLSGAVLVAAWLGQGTAFLLLKRRVAWILFTILAIGSVYAAYKVFTAQLDPTQMLSQELSGHAIVSPGVRVLTPFFNLYGVLLLAGGAVYSAWLFWRKRVLLHRVIGNLFIAFGALSPAFGGALQRFGVPSLLYLSELIGVILIFIGFQYAVREPARMAPSRLEQASVS
jgi:hypothetical protein